MSDQERLCQRAGCRQPASCTLTFRYDARQASLTDLSADRHPVHYDLCDVHANVLIVPRGWERLDRRTVRSAAPEHVAPPVGSVPAVESAPPRVDRYAVLTAQLPKLAEALGHFAAGGDEPGCGPAGDVTIRPAQDDVLDGQLQMPMEPRPGGVVVALSRARQ